MDNVIYTIFIFFTIPMLLMLAFLEKKSRITFSFVLLGVVICLLASEINSKLLLLLNCDYLYYSTTISPIVEELLKGLPVMFSVFVLSDRVEMRKTLSWGFAAGVGFAMFENIIVFFQYYETTGILWAIARGIGAGLMHGLCTATVGLGLYYVKRSRKSYFYGTFALLSLAMIYHGTYNYLVQCSGLKHFGILLPIVTYVLLYLFNKSQAKKTSKN